MLQVAALDTLTRDVQLHTHIPVDDVDGLKDDFRDYYESYSMASKSTYFECNFPIFAYNIGQRKIVIQNTLQGGKTYVYELPRCEKFMCFSKVNRNEDMGFYPIFKDRN